MHPKKAVLTQPKVKVQDFFKKGVVVFLESGHPLRISNGYYRCDLNCQGKCRKDRGQFKKENFERNFSRLAKHFAIDKNGADKMRKGLMREYFMDIIIGIDENKEGKEEIVRANIAKMEADTQRGKFIKRDVKDSFDQLVSITGEEYPLILFSYLLGITSTFSMPEDEKWLGRALAMITKHVYISKGGMIEKIEFDRWGWYILNLLDHYFPNYLWDIKQKVEIVNGHDPVTEQGLLEAIAYFEDMDFDQALRNEKADILYRYFSLIKVLMKEFFEGDSSSMQKASIDVLKKLLTDPIFQMVQTALALGAGEIKP